MDDRALRKNLKELLRGGQAHHTVKKYLSGIKPEFRHVRPFEKIHSIYEELEHMHIAQEDILRYTLDETWESLPFPDGYWPKDNDNLTEEMWEKSLSGFFKDLSEVIDLVDDFSIDLTSQIPHGEGRTYLREVLLVADHNVYHLGQIVQVRKILGNW